MAILSEDQLEKCHVKKYQEADIRKGNQLYGMSGKIIYQGKWTSKKADKIVIVEMNEAITEREARFYLEVNDHKHIIRTIGFVENRLNQTIFIQEYAHYNDLASVLMNNQLNIPQTVLKEMFIQIADAMSYVASKRIVHGDLGCRNVLVFHVDTSDPSKSLVKITDFGLARWIDRPPAYEDPTVIPIRFCAPEILRDKIHTSYSEKSDVYSMAVLIWEALSNGAMPYSAISDDKIVEEMKKANEKLGTPTIFHPDIWELMNKCWHKSPQKRPTFNEIKHTLFAIEIDEVSHRAQLHCEYELDTDVRITKLLSDGNHRIHEAQWITKEEGPIVLIEKNEEPSEHEKLIYSTFKNHPHIIHTYGFVENDRESVMILQERAPYGNLQSLLQSGEFQPSARVLVEIFLQIINTMIEIVDHGFVHGDLCCENILVFEMHSTDPKRNSVKLANFSLAHPNDRSYTDERRLYVPVRHCALEILRNAGRSNYSELSDVYSLGVLIWQACSQGRIPYESSITSSEVQQRKLKNEELPRPLNCDDQIWTIVAQCCLTNELEVRFNFEEVKVQFAKINLNRNNNETSRRGHHNKGYESSDEENYREPSSSKRPRIESAKPSALSTRPNGSDQKDKTNFMDISQESPTTKPTPTIRVDESIYNRPCKYCHESYPIDLLNEHETKFCRKRISTPAVKPPPTQLYEKCNNCHKQFRSNEIVDHRKNCQPESRPPIIHEPRPRSPVQSRQTNQQSSLNRANPTQITRESQPTSFWARFCPCFRS